jgi:branched-chain amino acid transport system substrate-binding protein
VRVGAALLVVGALGLAACSESAPSGGDRAGRIPGGGERCEEASVVACIGDDTTLGRIDHTPIRATGEPIRIGMINQETGAAGAFPELSRADEAAIAFINAELGGVNGRPLELEVCDTQFSPAGSQSCAQRMVQRDVVAVTGGIDVFGDGIRVLNDNGVPLVGGIPVSTASATVPTSFQFSGGIWGAFLGFVDFAVGDLRSKRIAIMYSDYGPIADAARTAQRAATRLGAEVTMVPFPIITTDFLTPLTAAARSGADAIIVGTADTGCVPSFRAAEQLGVEAALFFTGACAAPKILENAGATATRGAYFNIEQELPEPGTTDPDTRLYDLVLAKYAPDLDPAGAGTVSFRSVMNLYRRMVALGDRATDRPALLRAFRSAVDEPSFMGHPYTCDGRQLPGLPAMCSPQQVIVQKTDDGLEQRSGWIDVGALVTPTE